MEARPMLPKLIASPLASNAQINLGYGSSVDCRSVATEEKGKNLTDEEKAMSVESHNYTRAQSDGCNEYGTIYAISSDFGDRMTTQHLD